MESVDVVAVIGSCAPERSGYARRLASATRRPLISAAQLETEADPPLAAARLAPWADQPPGTVVEFPSTVPVTEIIAALADCASPTRLMSVVCIVDAAHLLDDLSLDDFVVSKRDALGRPADYVARSSLTVTQIEYASMIVLVGWEAVPTPQLATILALVSTLSPRARLRLDQNGVDAATPGIGSVAGESPEGSFDSPQDRAGWIGVLNADADPHMRDARVSAFSYEQLRPFHPERLSELLMRGFDSGAFGRVIRSAGFCRIATRPGTLLHWDHVGRTIAFHLADDAEAAIHESRMPEALDDASLTAGQELAFIGLDLEREALTAALDRAVLDDDEFTAGPAAWAGYFDPFPSQEPAGGAP